MAGKQEFIIIDNCINNYEVSLKNWLPSVLANVFILNKCMWIQSYDEVLLFCSRKGNKETMFSR